MIDKNYIQKLAEAIKETENIIKQVKVEDKGSCNLDTVIFDFTGWKSKEINNLALLSGIRISSKLKGYYTGYRFLYFNTNGIANLRTAQVEAAKKHLCDNGFNCSIWYSLD